MSITTYSQHVRSSDNSWFIAIFSDEKRLSAKGQGFQHVWRRCHAIYAVAQQNCLQVPDTRMTVMDRRSGGSSSNDDVERAAAKGLSCSGFESQQLIDINRLISSGRDAYRAWVT